MKYERIRNLREDKDLTQTDVAKYLHISQRTYSRYENDERAIPIEILSLLADFHCTSTDYLIGCTDIKNHIHKKQVKAKTLHYSMDAGHLSSRETGESVT